MSGREESEKFSLSFNGKLHLKFLGKSYWSPCNFEKAQVAVGWPNWDTNFIARLRMHFYRSKSTLGSLKSVLNVFRGKSSLRAPEWFNTSPIFNSPLPEQSWQLLIGVQRAKLITRKKKTLLHYISLDYLWGISLVFLQINNATSCQEFFMSFLQCLYWIFNTKSD